VISPCISAAAELRSGTDPLTGAGDVLLYRAFRIGRRRSRGIGRRTSFGRRPDVGETVQVSPSDEGSCYREFSPGSGKRSRAALNSLATIVPDWLRAHVPMEWYERYADRVEDFRMPKEVSKRHALAEQIGADGFQCSA